MTTALRGELRTKRTSATLALCAGLAALSATTSASAQSVLTNGSFSAHPLSFPWTQPSSVTVGTTSSTWPNLHVQPQGLTDSVTYSLSTNAVSASAHYVTSFWINLTSPASVRLTYTIPTSPSATAYILAERAIREDEAGTWVEVKGSRQASWAGAGLVGTLKFEVFEIAGHAGSASTYPAYDLDEVSIAPDNDGDGISNAVEAATCTNNNQCLNKNNEDTDGDDLPDAWEVRYSPMLNPINFAVSDKHLDPDGDGYSNWEELNAATDPTKSTSQPGVPSVTNSNYVTGEILRYLALRPGATDGLGPLIGQHISDNGDVYQYDDLYDPQGLGNVELPAIFSAQYDDFDPVYVTAPANMQAPACSTPPPVPNFGSCAGSPTMQVDATNEDASNRWSDGALVSVKWNPFNPWTGCGYSDYSFIGQWNCQNDTYTIASLIDPDPNDPIQVAAAARLDGWLAELETGLGALRDAGVTVLFRPLSEMNLGQFWWAHRSREEYVKLWRVIHYRLRTAGLDNVLWVYESDSGIHDSIPADYYYPGDAWVDVMGHNLLRADCDQTTDWDLPDDIDRLYRRYPKVHAISQAGPHGCAPNDPHPDDWNILHMQGSIATRHPRLSYFIAWNSFTNGGVFQASAIIDSEAPFAMLNTLPTVTVSELPLPW